MPLRRERLLQLMGPLPTPAPLAPQVEERVVLEGGLVRERVTYQVEKGERIAAYLFLPPGDRPRPAILCLHQHAGQYDLGKSEPAGLAGDPNQFLALELARRGYVTLTYDHLGFEERRHPRLAGRDYERFEFTRRLSDGRTLQAKYAGDAMRAVDYLLTRPEVDGRRLGCIGHSLGGQQTLFTMALDPRLRVGVASCGFASLASIFAAAINHNFALYVPGLAAEGDIGDLLALVAPRPFLIVAGREDPIFPFTGVLAAYHQARAVYAQAGAADRLALLDLAAGHAFPPDARAQAYAWFDRWLGA
jgi:dienelactone hydrolase